MLTEEGAIGIRGDASKNERPLNCVPLEHVEDHGWDVLSVAGSRPWTAPGLGQRFGAARW